MTTEEIEDFIEENTPPRLGVLTGAKVTGIVFLVLLACTILLP